MPKFAANLSMMFGEFEFIDRFEAAAKAGFVGVEYLFPYASDKQRLVELLQRFELTQVLYNLPAGKWDAGERGIACHPNRRDEFRQGVELAIEYAQALDCRQVNCLAGITPATIDPSVARATLVENLRYAARRLAEVGVRLLIEPINTRDIPGFFLCGTAQALNIIDEVDSDNLYLQYDIYHMQIMEGDLATTIARHLEQIAHMQLADNPGRHEPGTGEINYDFLLDYVDSLGYRGWIGCEYKPLTRTEAGLDWLDHYRPLTSSAGYRG